MSKYIKKYLKNLESSILMLGSMSDKERTCFLNDVITHIKMIQHERLIHLIVLCLFAIIFFMCILAMICFSVLYILPLIILIVALIVPYIIHYYFLENNTQKLYHMYDSIYENIKSLENKNGN